MTPSVEKDVARLAALLHGEFCTDPDCKGVHDYIPSAERLLPQIKRYVTPPGLGES